MSKIKNNHYKFNSYVDLNRFISYYYQIKFVLDLNPKTILEIGVGNNFFIIILSQITLICLIVI